MAHSKNRFIRGKLSGSLGKKIWRNAIQHNDTCGMFKADPLRSLIRQTSV
jgi:hypothetical protein